MKWNHGSLAGLLAGLAGAALWATATYYSGWELGWLAWAIGLAVGVAVHLGAGSENHSSPSASPGLIAALLTLVAIFSGKLVTSVLLEERAAAGQVLAAEEDLLSLEEPERVISYLADDVVLHHLERGEELSWPEGVDPLFAAGELDYPAEVWSEAARLWEEMDLPARRDFIDDIRSSSALASQEVLEMDSAWQALRKGFGPIDLLFFALALLTAFKAGVGKLA